MTAPASQLTIGGVAVDGYATEDIDIQYSELGGSTILRRVDGVGILQHAWSKTRIVITGNGRAPSGLRALNKTALSVDVPDPEEVGGTRTYTVFAVLTERHAYNRGRATWTLTLEEE